MRKNSSSRLNIYAVFASFALLSIDLLLMLQPTVSAQSNCPNVPKLGAPHWEPNHSVTVVFQNDSNWTDDEIAVMKKAFDEWTAAKDYFGNNSGVVFAGFFRGPAPDKNTATHTVIVRRLEGHGAPSMGTVANNNSGGYAAVGFLEWDAEAAANFFPSWDPKGLGFTGTTSHEIGHSFKLGDCYSCANTIMCSGCGIYGPTTCDNCKVNLYCNYSPSVCVMPTPTPAPTAPPSCPTPSGSYLGNCTWDPYQCKWVCWGSPILVDVNGDGFTLTNAAGGVMFDLDGSGATKRLAWTTANSDDAWLALDHNGNGTIDSGSELFGNFTPQPPSPAPNGFLALAEYDRPQVGGNSDGVVDSRDSIFSSLRLWQDTNHNGISEPSELNTLPALGLASIELGYKESKRTDEFGNQFRYRSKVNDSKGAKVSRWAWDVFLVSGR